MAILFKIDAGDHHGVATATEVASVFEFFGEEVTGVDDARDMFDLGEDEMASPR